MIIAVSIDSHAFANIVIQNGGVLKRAPSNRPALANAGRSQWVESLSKSPKLIMDLLSYKSDKFFKDFFLDFLEIIFKNPLCRSWPL
jgi:hypothetical protein